jgi:type I restriction enzyme S subunit
MENLLELVKQTGKVALEDVCHYVTERIPISEVARNDYISTENMLPNKAGVTEASTIPSGGSVTRYKMGDTLTSNIRPYFKKIWMAKKNGGCSNDVLVFRPNDEKELDKTFLYAALSKDAFFAHGMMGSRGTKMPRGDKDGIMKYQIPLPSLPVQKRIAEILSAYDEKITNNNSIIKNLEATAQAIFDEWFKNFRFPGHEKIRMVASEVEEIPEGWSVSGITDIANRLSVPKMYKEETLNEHGSVPVYDQSSKGRIGFHDETPSFAANVSRPVITFGDHTCRVQLVCEPFSLGPNTIPLGEKDGYALPFVFFLIQNAIVQREYKRHWNELASMQFIVPPHELTQEYSEQIQPFIETMVCCEKENDVMKKIRNSLVTKLV